MSKKRKIKLTWLSANLFGYELLKTALQIKKSDIGEIVILKEKAGTKMYDGIEKNKWLKFDIPVHEIENINNEKRLLSSFRPDFVVMAGWRQMIEKDILKIPNKGFIGFHPTLLPKGRGPAPIINTILGGLRRSGVTMFYVAQEIDNGNIIGQEQFEVSDNDYAEDVYKKIIEAGKKLIRKFLPLLIKNKAPRIAQDKNEVTYFPKRTLKDNEIKLDKESPDEIYRKIRAFSKPYNGAYIKLKGKKLIIWKAELKNEKKS